MSETFLLRDDEAMSRNFHYFGANSLPLLNAQSAFDYQTPVKHL